MHDAIIQAEGLVKRLGRVRALDGLTLAVQPGTIHCLLGPNGAGKTTLIRVPLLPPDASTARIGGVDVRSDPAGVCAQIGLAGQFAAVDDYLTSRENVEMVGRLYGLSLHEARRRARRVLEHIRLAGVADRQVKTYSGGMRRRLDLAACLVGGPRAAGPVRPVRQPGRLLPDGRGPRRRGHRPAPLPAHGALGGARRPHPGRPRRHHPHHGPAAGRRAGHRLPPADQPPRRTRRVAIVLGFGYAWSWAMAALGLVVRTPEAVQAASFMGAFPLAFTSSVLVPTQTMPGWLRAFAAHQPVTVTTKALRGLILDQGTLPQGQTVTGQVLLALDWSAAITAVFAPLAVHTYRHTVS